jgi:hypothetical protein
MGSSIFESSVFFEFFFFKACWAFKREEKWSEQTWEGEKQKLHEVEGKRGQREKDTKQLGCFRTAWMEQWSDSRRKEKNKICTKSRENGDRGRKIRNSSLLCAATSIFRMRWGTLRSTSWLVQGMSLSRTSSLQSAL